MTMARRTIWSLMPLFGLLGATGSFVEVSSGLERGSLILKSTLHPVSSHRAEDSDDSVLKNHTTPDKGAIASNELTWPSHESFVEHQPHNRSRLLRLTQVPSRPRSLTPDNARQFGSPRDTTRSSSESNADSETFPATILASAPFAAFLEASLIRRLFKRKKKRTSASRSKKKRTTKRRKKKKRNEAREDDSDDDPPRRQTRRNKRKKAREEDAEDDDDDVEERKRRKKKRQRAREEAEGEAPLLTAWDDILSRCREVGCGGRLTRILRMLHQVFAHGEK
ncbi:putative transmembrane protein [Toxoplasma gondii MAS]|uniref:Putative transmembrane protein n=1 Tax=Toxoplasma gondii MAS TaxID=943118 RepID=A0A086QDU6_TOXGO|nr:putative transmembrane protein [Toxoplasma gondii MAS]